jgi:hypothetical protein
LLWLVLGDFERGWPEYEYRWTQPGFQRRSFSQPAWNGSALAGKTILLHAEQGLGDTIQFIRYAAEIKRQHSGQIVVACQDANCLFQLALGLLPIAFNSVPVHGLLLAW